MKPMLVVLSLLAGLLQAQAATFTDTKHLTRLNAHNFKDNDSQTTSLAQFLNTAMAYDMDRLEVSESTLPDGVCGTAFYVDITVHGFWNDVQAKIDFYAQTLSKENQDRLYNAIRKNYASKGLPSCLLNDQFYTKELVNFKYQYEPDQTTVLVPAKAQPVPNGFLCAGQILRPLTSCWDIKDLYPKPL